MDLGPEGLAEGRRLFRFILGSGKHHAAPLFARQRIVPRVASTCCFVDTRSTTIHDVHAIRELVSQLNDGTVVVLAAVQSFCPSNLPVKHSRTSASSRVQEGPQRARDRRRARVGAERFHIISYDQGRHSTEKPSWKSNVVTCSSLTSTSMFCRPFSNNPAQAGSLGVSKTAKSWFLSA